VLYFLLRMFLLYVTVLLPVGVIKDNRDMDYKTRVILGPETEMSTQWQSLNAGILVAEMTRLYIAHVVVCERDESLV